MERKQWNDLSMTEKSEMMKVAVRNGITNLNDIRQAYNEFADGGDIVTPVTTSGSGYIPTAVMPSQIVEDAKNKIIKDVMGELPMEEVRRRLYKNLYPHGYDDYKNRFRNAVKNNQSELYKYKYPFWERGRAGDVRVPIFGEYLQIPVNEREDNIYGRQLLESQYTPTKGKEQGITYYRIPGFPDETDKRNLIADSYGMYNPWNEGNWEYRQSNKIDKELNKKQINDLVEARNKSVGIDENKLSSVLGSAFGPHTLGRGYDAKGEYVSYYDKWDLAPYKHQGEDQSNGIGKPVHFYDRIYLDDFYQVPTKYRGGYYLPEVTVTPEKAFGGPLVQSANKYGEGGKLGQQVYVEKPDATYVQRQEPVFPIKPELSEEAALRRTAKVYSNYSKAKDNPLSLGQERFRNTLRWLQDRGLNPFGSGVSNCTLTATQWVDPTNPIKNAKTIVNNPEQYHYQQIDSIDAIPGNIVIAENPNNGAFHTMMIESFADKDGTYDFEGVKYPYKKGDPLMVYSRGGHDNSAIRRGIPLDVYTKNSEGKTKNRFYRYDYPNNIMLKEIVVTPKK
jgi:hypothetical protein